jgi:hypothetical protein
VSAQGELETPTSGWECVRWRRWLATLSEADVEIVVRKVKSLHSRQQEAWHWGVALPLMANASGYDRHEHNDLHYWLVAKCFGTHERDGLTMPNKRSSQLTTKEYSELMDWEVRFASDMWGVFVPMPNEVDYTSG